MNGVSGHFSGDRYVMSFVSLEHIRIVNVHYFLVAVGDNNRLRALAKHLFMQAAWFALAPFTPQLESLTYPFTVVVLSAAEATATVRNTSENAAKLTNTFFITAPLFAVEPADL